jgi:nitrite reductase/ring-hydroxylating ferredoxin subunit
MGENFVAFRATDGRVGFFDEGCPHRGTSLALARNEDNALRCIFHGWKIDVSGCVVEAPSEPVATRDEFAKRIRVSNYPVREAGGIVWVYLGKQSEPPEFFKFEFMTLPETHVNPTVAIVHANWVQGLEAVLDSSHAGALHSAWLDKDVADSFRQYGSAAFAQVDTGPTFEFVSTTYGYRECALRDLGNVFNARLRDVALPYYSFIPRDEGIPCLLVAPVPIDDEWTAQWYIAYDPWLSPGFRKGTREGSSGSPDNFCSDMGSVENLWHQDRELMKKGHFSGINRCIPYEDFIVQESMGPIVDRTREQLGMSDIPVVRGRRLLLKSVQDYLANGKALNAGTDYSKLRALAITYDKSLDWRTFDVQNPPSYDISPQRLHEELTNSAR